jgi:hypothetical protein
LARLFGEFSNGAFGLHLLHSLRPDDDFPLKITPIIYNAKKCPQIGGQEVGGGWKSVFTRLPAGYGSMRLMWSSTWPMVGGGCALRGVHA